MGVPGALALQHDVTFCQDVLTRMALFNRSQAGEFGEVSMGVFGGTVQPQH